MKDLLQYIAENIIDKSEFDIEEKTEGNQIYETIRVDKEKVGLIIGKEGKTIKAIQEILRAKAKLEGVSVFVNVEEK